MKIVILAGGSGTRLWPLSRDTYPKQFLSLGDETSLLQHTINRFSGHDLLILTNPASSHLVKAQAPGCQILVEPERKNTAPAILLAIKYFIEQHGFSRDETILVAPSDHIIRPEAQFLALLPQIDALAKEGRIIALGATPDKPETGYGYLEMSPESHHVVRFIEKPSYEDAQRYVSQGNYLWNCGIFAFSSETLLEQIEQHSPELKAFVNLSYQELMAAFSSLPSISIDYAVMERSSCISALPLSSAWSDLGSWDSVFDALHKDADHNVKCGNIHATNTKNSLLYGGKRLISTIGLEDMIVVDTDDALFLGKKGETQQVKFLVESLKKQQTKEVNEHVTTVRPWGQYSILEVGPRYKVKRILVNPGHTLSLQLHYHRSEHWVVVSGTAKITIGTEEKLLHENESVYISKSTLHRLENPGKVPLEMIEVQVGEYTGEDDIVRFEDNYGRV